MSRRSCCLSVCVFKPPMGESVSSSPACPPVEACDCRGHTLIDYRLFSTADLDITSPLPDYIDICFYYLLICASRNNSFLLFYRKQHCKASVLNHNYLPVQFMHLCPWGAEWREFTGTSGYFSPTVSCYWCFCLLVIFFFFTHSVSQGKNKQARDNDPGHEISSGDLTDVLLWRAEPSDKARRGGIVWTDNWLSLVCSLGFPTRLRSLS